MKKILVILSVLALSGCVHGLNRAQKDELHSYQSRGLKVIEKEENLAAGLGILPGVGSFYTGHVGYGILNLLLWPASVLWDPISGYNGAQQANYHATKTSVNKKRKKALKELTFELEDKKISQKQYLIKKREIEDQYDAY